MASKHDKSSSTEDDSDIPLKDLSESESPLDSVSDVEEYESSGKVPESFSLPCGGKVIKVKSVLLLCNSHSGSGKGKEVGREAKRMFKQAKVDPKIIYLEHQGHAEEICKTDDLSKYDVVCCVGGDGTFHEAANGILKSKHNTKIPLAFVPAGTGNSFSLELGIGTNTRRAVDHVLRGLVCPIDAIKISFETDKEDIYSVNSIHWGLASSVNVTAEKLRWMGHSLRYTTAAIYEFARGEKTAAKIEFETADGKQFKHEGEYCLVIANNIRGAAKGMKIAPEAKINDGLVDLLLIRTSGKYNLLQAFAKAYSASHTELDYVLYEKVREFSITSYQSKEFDKEVEELIDIDGELNGITPFSAEVLPRILNIII